MPPRSNDAVGAIPRLIDLGVPDYLVAATLEGVLAQRLVRRVCPDCRVSYEVSAEQVALLSGRPSTARTLVEGRGCDACRGTGYRGRIGLFELLTFNDEIKDAVARGARRAELHDLARSSGMVTLREDGWRKIEEGATTVEEVVRVTTD